ncbi:MAG: hypothetical protein Q8880_01935 [Bacteroidota bacterium]|nr:hypothetical protein [Bacteroidota bacterium]
MYRDSENIIDELFRKEFKDYSEEPSKDSWNNISSRINTGKASSSVTSGLLSKRIYLGLIAGIILIAGALFVMPTQKNEIKPTVNTAQKTTAESAISSVNIAKKSIAKANTDNVSYNNINNLNNVNSINKEQNNDIKFTQINNNATTSGNSILNIRKASFSANNNFSGTKNRISNLNPLNTKELISSAVQTGKGSYQVIENTNNESAQVIFQSNSKSENSNLKLNSINDLILKKIMPKNIYDIALNFNINNELITQSTLIKKPVDYFVPEKKRGIFSLGINGSDDYLYNVAGSANNGTRNYGIDLSLTYTLNNLFIQSGIGMSYYKDNISFNTIYDKLKLVESYEYVDSMYYNANKELTAAHHTVNIYDTLKNGIKAGNIITSYYYLQIPVIGGFQKDLGKKFKYYFKGGLIFATIIDKKEIKDDFISSSEIINIRNDQKSTETYNFNYNMVLGAGFSYRLTERININLEPTFKYYLHSIYKENANNTNLPYSFGVRTGLSIDL